MNRKIINKKKNKISYNINKSYLNNYTILMILLLLLLFFIII